MEWEIWEATLDRVFVKGLRAFRASFTDASKERREAVTAETGVAHVDSNAECVRRSKYVVLAVKPQVISHVFEDIRGELSSDQIVISIVAGYATRILRLDWEIRCGSFALCPIRRPW